MRRIRYAPSQLLALMLFALVTLAMPSSLFAQIGITITIAPPMLPVYEQPVIPGAGYIWTPGYWAWSPEEGGYYWVPGTWVLAPQVGVLWTPGYWGWGGNEFVWNPGYWGPHIGFYGGVNYGYGYTGNGYEGGHWNNGAFFYNRSVNNITNVTNITNVYNRTVVNNITVNNVSYNGGNGGLRPDRHLRSWRLPASGIFRQPPNKHSKSVPPAPIALYWRRCSALSISATVCADSLSPSRVASSS